MLNKKIILLLILSISSILFSITATAHSGRTDANGGHNDNINGGYHYHHGYPAHDHPNGKCPYDFDDYSFDEEKVINADERDIVWYIYSIFRALICSFVIYFLLSSIINIILSFFIDTDKYFLVILITSITIIFIILLFLIL